MPKQWQWGIHPDYLIPDDVWSQMQASLPAPKVKKVRGRPRMDDRQAMTAILYVLRTGIPWKALPRSLGAASTVHQRFTEWRGAGVFTKIWQAGLHCYDVLRGIDWQWQSMDGAMTKAPFGKKTRTTR